MNRRTSSNRRPAKPGAYRAGHCPTVAILVRDFHAASAIARMAELAGMAVGVFWSVDELTTTSPWPWDVLIIDKSEWRLLTEWLERRANTARTMIGGSQVIVLDPSEYKLDPQAVVDQLMSCVGRDEHGWGERLAIVDVSGDYARLLVPLARFRGVEIDHYKSLAHLATDARLDAYAAVVLRSEDDVKSALASSVNSIALTHGLPFLIVTEQGMADLPAQAPEYLVFRDIRDIEGALAMTLTLARRQRRATSVHRPDDQRH